MSTDSVPQHLQKFPGLSVRSGDQIMPAPEADVAVARGYPVAASKGAWIDGRRITLMTAALQVKVGAPVRVIHVVESTRAGDELYVMGPKAVLGERVDGKPVTPAASSTGDPLMPPGTYDGRVVPAPAVDYNYEITEYKLPRGSHMIEWQLGTLRANALQIEVVE